VTFLVADHVFHATRGFNLAQAVVCAVMCHHVDMAIDWDEVETESESRTRTVDTTETGEPELDAEESPPEAAPPADD